MIDLKDTAKRANAQRDEDNLIVVDVDGTLFQGEFGRHNETLVKYLKVKKAEGFRIQIASNDQQSAKTTIAFMERLMRMKGIDFAFGEVDRKDNYNGVKVFQVIDDDHGSHKINCDNLYSPVDARIKAAVTQAVGFDFSGNNHN